MILLYKFVNRGCEIANGTEAHVLHIGSPLLTPGTTPWLFSPPLPSPVFFILSSPLSLAVLSVLHLNTQESISAVPRGPCSFGDWSQASRLQTLYFTLLLYPTSRISNLVPYNTDETGGQRNSTEVEFNQIRSVTSLVLWELSGAVLEVSKHQWPIIPSTEARTALHPWTWAWNLQLSSPRIAGRGLQTFCTLSEILPFTTRLSAQPPVSKKSMHVLSTVYVTSNNFPKFWPKLTILFNLGVTPAMLSSDDWLWAHGSLLADMKAFEVPQVEYWFAVFKASALYIVPLLGSHCTGYSDWLTYRKVQFSW